MLKNEIEVGKVLLSEPFMYDPHFKRSAVLLCEHSEEGSIGFIMNKPMNIRIDDLIEGFPEFDADVYFGGPVQTDTIHYIHNVGNLLEDSLKVTDGVYWGGDFDKLKFLINSNLVLPKDIRFFVGYSGWSEGQLVDELSYGSWVTAEMDANYLFKSRPNKLWSIVMHNKGNAYTVIARMPDAVIWN